MEFKEGLGPSERKEEPGMKEDLAETAIRYKGMDIPGYNHAYIIRVLQKKFPDFVIGDAKYGYITTRGRFVDIDEADNIRIRQKRKRWTT